MIAIFNKRELLVIKPDKEELEPMMAFTEESMVEMTMMTKKKRR